MMQMIIAALAAILMVVPGNINLDNRQVITNDDGTISTEFSFSDGVFKNTIKKGKGSYYFPGFPGGVLDITVDLNKGTVEFVLQ